MSLTNILALQFGYAKVFTIYAVIAFLSCVATFVLCRENVGKLNDIMRGSEKDTVRLKDLFKALFTNKYALFLMIYIIILFSATTIIQTGGVYYATNVLGDQVLYSKFMVFMVIGNVIGFLVAAPLVKKVGSKKIFLFGAIISAVCAAIMFISNGRSFMLICIGIMILAVTGITFTTTQIMAMTGDCVDYGEWKTGTRAEGTISAVSTIGTKIGGALGSAILSAIMAAGGYISGAETQTAGAVSSINFAFMGMPFILYALLAIFYLFTWKIEKQRKQMREEIMAYRMTKGEK